MSGKVLYIFLIVLNVLAFAACLVFVYLFMYTDTFSAQSAFPFDTKNESVVSYGVRQYLNAKVERIETDTVSDQKVDTYSLLFESDTFTKQIDVHMVDLGDGSRGFDKERLFYWDSTTHKWYTHSEKPSTIGDFIEVGDEVYIQYENVYFKGELQEIVRIKGVIKQR